MKWDYASREAELEAIGWYLTGRLDANSKLDLELGTAVNACEHLRHAIKLPGIGRFLKVPFKRARTAVVLSADFKTGQWLDIPEFPQFPCTKFSPSSREALLNYFNAEQPAFYPADIRELEDWGVLKDLSKLAKSSKHAKQTVTGEIGVFRQTSVIPFTVDFSARLKVVERSFQRWKEENRSRFAKDGRSLAGTRAANNPLVELKDLAVARLLYLHSFDVRQASKWAHDSQPLDASRRIIPWFNKKQDAKERSRLFEDSRDWDRALKRFEKTFAGWHRAAKRFEKRQRALGLQ
jgi:hypothetical protein